MSSRTMARVSAGLLSTTLVAGAVLIAAGPASALEVYDPICPVAQMYKGVATVPSPALSLDDDNAELSITAGALPAGISLTGNVATHTPYVFEGTPTMVSTSTFTVTARFDDAGPKSIACTVQVDELPVPTRIQGADRYEQAAKVVASKYTTADTVYLASGEVFADALSAGSVAGVHGAPLLLTKKGELPAATKTALTTLAPKHIVVVGGPAAVSPGVFDGLKRDFTGAETVRIGGADRYAVSRALIEDATFGIPSSVNAYVASGVNFPDALAATPAAIGFNGPVLLVDGSADAVTGPELATLDGLGVAKVRIAGGPSAVSQKIQTQLDARFEVTRATGADRYATAISVNAEAFAAADTVYLASGESFPDALSAGPIAGENSSPVFLSRPDCVPPTVLDAIERLKPDHIVVLGGPNALAPAIDHLKAC